MKAHNPKYAHGTALRWRQFAVLTLAIFVLMLFSVPVSAETAYADVPGFSDYLEYKYSNNYGDTTYGLVTTESNTGTTTITITAKHKSTTESSIFGSYTKYYATTTTFTLHNKLSYPITVIFSSSNFDTTPGVSPLTIAGGGTAVFTVVTPTSWKGETSDKSGTLTITACEVPEVQYNTTFASGVNGSYAVTHDDYTDIAADGTTKYASVASKQYTLTPSANEGYILYGWADSSGLLSLTKSDDGTQYYYYGEADNTIWPVFRKMGAAMYYIEGTPGTFYDSLDLANTAAAASTSKKIVVCASGNVIDSQGRNSIAISDGVTLLIPYSASDLTIMTGSSTTNNFAHANVQFTENEDKSVVVTKEAMMDPELSVLYTLTIPADTTLNVNGTSSSSGRVVIGGTILGSQGTNTAIAEGLCYGAHSNLVVNGTLNLNDYSILSAVGYVLGDGEINATGTGATLYQPFVIHDWRGGRAAQFFVGTSLGKGLTAQSGEDQIIPFFQWTTMNIRPKLTMTYGNQMIAYASLYDGEAYCSYATLVGSGGLVQLSSGASLTSQYEDISWGSYTYGFPGRNAVTISGEASLGSFTMTGDIGLGSIEVDTADFVLPISYAYSITLKSGTFTIDNSMSLLPGSKIEVDSSATLNINAARFMVFDGLYQGLNHSTSSTGTTSTYTKNTRVGSQKAKLYPTTSEIQGATVNGTPMSADAEFIVDGTLVIGENANFGGVIQTTGTGTIDATAGTAGSTTGTSVQIGVVGNKAIMALSQNSSIAGMSLHERKAQIVSAATGERRDIIRGVIYKGSAYETTQEGYSFKYYAASSNTASVMLIGDATAADTETTAATYDAHPLNETIRGAWTCETHTGVDTDHTCDVCGYQIPVAMIDNTRYESLQAALDAVLEGDTIVLLAAPEDGVVFNKCVTIDTNGITYNIKCAEGWEAIDKGDGIYLVRNMSLFDIYASSIRAGDSLDLYFYIDPDNLGGSSKSEFKASITRYYAGGSPKTTTVDGSQWTDSDDYYRFSYNGIAAKEMTDKIFVTIYKGDTQVSNVRMETVENYALRVLNKQVKDADANSKAAALRTTLVDMLNYGAACQTYFDGYAADNPANAQIDDFQQYATQSVTYDNTQTGDEGIYGSSVSAESNLVYTFYYTFNPSDRNLTAYVTYEDHYGKNVELTIRSFREKQGYYGVDVEGLAVADGRQTITCQLKDENGEVTHTASGNVESYVAVAVANAGEDKDVFLSLLKFVDSARAYFHSGEET